MSLCEKRFKKIVFLMHKYDQSDSILNILPFYKIYIILQSLPRKGILECTLIRLFETVNYI